MKRNGNRKIFIVEIGFTVKCFKLLSVEKKLL